MWTICASALYLHSLIEQISAVIYAATLGRPWRVKTPIVTVSFHQFPPQLFTGFDVSQAGAKIATPEKALFDVLYLAPGKSRLFAHLPELEVADYVRTRLISVRAYDEAHLMTDALVCEGTGAAAAIQAMFAREDVAYIHLHNANRGCFSCAVVRV
jgi:hypothetical protein